MNKNYIFLFFVLGIILFSGCSQKPAISAQIRMCPGTYYLEESLNQNINDDEEAFNILKIGNVYDTKNETMWVEDKISSDMNVGEAIEKGLFKKAQQIILESGEIVKPVWMFATKEKALDQEGQIVISDRQKFTTMTLFGAFGVPRNTLYEAVYDLPDPGRTIYLDANPAISVARSMQTEPGKVLKTDLELQQRVRGLYKEFGKNHRFIEIEANQNIYQVSDLIYKIVRGIHS